jgi:hypothetical protein
VEQDQLTRLVQECVAQADWRWQARALDAWTRSRPIPAQPAQEETLRTCMQEARVGLVAENADLKRRLGEVASDRETMRASVDQERSRADQERTRFMETIDKNLGRLQDSHDRIAGYLGEAAQKPAGNATATASSTSASDGKATNDSGTTLTAGTTADSGSSAPSAVTASAPVAAIPATPVVVASPAVEKPAGARAARAVRPAIRRAAAPPAPGCEVPKGPAQARAATAAEPPSP